MINSPMGMLRALKGAPLSCFYALALANQPLGIMYLCEVTGYTDKPIRSALHVLAELGMAVQTGRTESWQLAGDYKQLPLMFPQLSDNVENGNSSRNYSDSPSTTTTLNKGIDDSLVNSSSSKNSSRNYSDSNVDNGKMELTDDQKAVKSMLYGYGVGEPKLTQLVMRDYMTPDYVEAHIKAAKEDKLDLKLFIHRLDQHDIKPEWAETPAFDYHKYITGPLSKYIANSPDYEGDIESEEK